ncbi:hypothetical protein [Candidatus Oscillochloris fontis]|uniref:hypothetical protein n=1 Tax=Candidatus Oscillochloris fontis TaxID=2496868 RepID=UPI00101C8E05|nr:hypothetical protein [Candidatus Oscillochloris fontis]
MTLDEAIAELTNRISAASPSSVVRITRVSGEEATIRAYAPTTDENAIKDTTLDLTIQLLTSEGLDIQVLVYDIATSLPPEE